MKKYLMLFLLLALSFGLYACGEDNDTNGDDDGVDMTPVVVELDRHYEGMNFFNDGIAEATLARCVDGDTTHFNVNDTTISLRYLSVDTPESTFIFEPWGKAASDYVCEILKNAETIVLEAETPGAQDGNGRYLGYVWVDGELLQLKLIREGYSRVFGGGKYATELFKAQLQAQEEGLKMHGEEDPLFSTVHEIPNLSYLLNNYEKYEYQPITITLTVISIRQSGSAGSTQTTVVLGDDSTNQTIDLYLGYGLVSYIFDYSGNIIEFDRLVPSYFGANRQLVNFDRKNSTLIFENN